MPNARAINPPRLSRLVAAAMLGLLLGAAPALAQSPPTTRPTRPAPPTTRPDQPGERPQRNQRGNARDMNRLFDQIRHATDQAKASETQKAAVDEALDLATQDMMRLRPGMRAMDPPQRAETLRTFRESLISEVRGLLDESQHPAYDEAIRAPMPPERRDGPEGDGARNDGPQAGEPNMQAAAIQRFTAYWAAIDELEGLSDVQKEKLGKVRTRVEADVRQLAGDDSEPELRRQAMRQKMQSVQRDVNEILDENQREALRAAMAELDQRNAGPAANETRMIRQAVAALQELDLSDDQRERVKAVVDAVQPDLRRIVEQADGDRRAAGEKLRTRFEKFRSDLGEILTPEQRAELQEKLDARRDRDAPPAGAAGAAMGGAMNGEMADMNPGDSGRQALAGAAADEPADSRFLDRLTAPQGLAVGATLPEGLSVLSITNRATPLRGQFDEHKPTILLLGCASSPTFRDRVGDIPWLIQQLRTASGRDAEVIVIYVREQYPASEWELDRNRADGFELAQPTTAEQRVEVANNLRRWGGMNGTGLSMFVDTMDNATLLALTGGTSTVGNYAFIFKPDGTLSARQQWFDPTGILDLVQVAAQ